jgi:hypothetical protein
MMTIDASGRKRGGFWRKNMRWCDGHRQDITGISCLSLHNIFFLLQQKSCMMADWIFSLDININWSINSICKQSYCCSVELKLEFTAQIFMRQNIDLLSWLASFFLVDEGAESCMQHCEKLLKKLS